MYYSYYIEVIEEIIIVVKGNVLNLNIVVVYFFYLFVIEYFKEIRKVWLKIKIDL